MANAIPHGVLASPTRYAILADWLCSHADNTSVSELWRDAIAEGEARERDRSPKLTREQVAYLRDIAVFHGHEPKWAGAIKAALAALGETAETKQEDRA